MKSIVDTEAIYRTTILNDRQPIATCTSDNLIKHYEFLKENEQAITKHETLSQDISEAAFYILTGHHEDPEYYNNLYSDFRDDILGIAAAGDALSNIETDSPYFKILLKTLKNIVEIVMTDESKAPLQLEIFNYLNWELPITFNDIN